MRKLSLVMAVCVVGSVCWSQDMTTTETNYRANFIVQLVKNVEWPAGTGKDASGAVVIGVVGQSSLTPELRALANDSTRKGPTLVVREFKLDDSLANCQILFMSTKEPAELAKILKKTEGRPVLTVSEAEYFGRYGVMINLFTETENGTSKVRFQVNRRTSKEAGLKFSADLLKQATPI
jgi:hypothetical protein